MNNLVFIVFDSARFDHVKAAKMPWLKRLGRLEKRFSYASWTSPSHFNYLMGVLPHASPKRVFSSEVYQAEFLKWRGRLGLRDISFRTFLPELSLPKALAAHGYATHGLVSMPVLNPETAHSLHFDRYELMPAHNEFHSIVDRLEFTRGKPRFYFINAGETHYPYQLQGEAPLPRLHGVHGTFKHLGDRATARPARQRFFSGRELKALKHKQIDCLEHLDGLLERLYAKCPPKTHIIVTSDHGELFGEDGYFGHGPIMHEKVFEIPFVEGRVPR